MITMTDIQAQLEKIDMQILDLLEERTRILQGQGVGPEEAAESAGLWLEEAADRGLDEARVEKIAKLIVGMCKATGE